MYVPEKYPAMLARSSVSTNSSFAQGLIPLVTYSWPSSIRLSDNAAIEGIINDIPFFSVGLLAFGVLTFFFVLRRLSMSVTYLHASVIFAFLGAVLDFSQILARGEKNVDQNLDIIAVWPLIVMRELSLACSVGVRLLFFWSFVGEPPRGEALSPASDPGGLHGGRWEKDGIVGVIVKWLLLLGVLAVPVLQAVWRLIAQVHEFGPVYYTDNILEIALSGLFIIKLFLNTFHTTLSPRLRVARDYSPVVLALLINLGIAIGNMITFEFSESTLGRFLQAVEFYILILHVLIISFYKRNVRDSVASWTSRPEPSSRFEALPMPQPFEQGFRISKFPAVVSGEEQARMNVDTMRARSSRHRSHMSSTSRLSTWLARRLSTQPPSVEDIGQERLWNQDQAERGLSPLTEKPARESMTESMVEMATEGPGLTVEYPSRQRITLSQAMMPSGASRTPSPVVMPTLSRRPTPIETQVLPLARPPSSDGFSPDNVHAPSASLSTIGLSDFVHATKTPDREPPMPTDSVIPASLTGMSVLQYYTGSEDVAMPSIRDTHTVPDSPIYGLTGAVSNNSTSEERLKAQLAMDDVNSARSSGIENILRQQEELDKSIANLRLLEGMEPSKTDLGTEESRSDLRVMSQSLASHGSISARSDLSLSHFPAPPTFATNSIVKSRKTESRKSMISRPGFPRFESDPSSAKRSTFGEDFDEEVEVEDGEDQGEAEDEDDITAILEPPRMPAAIAEQSFPTAVRASGDSSQDTPAFRGVRFVSGGTQYDVTSFIGNSLPVVGEEALHSPVVSDKAWTTDDEESEDATIVTVARKHSSSRPKYVQKSALATSGLPTFPKPVAPSLTSTGAAGSPTSLRGGRVGLPPRPRLGVQISSPIRQKETETPSSAYERPRKAPSALAQGSPLRSAAKGV